MLDQAVVCRYALEPGVERDARQPKLVMYPVEFREARRSEQRLRHG